MQQSARNQFNLSPLYSAKVLVNSEPWLNGKGVRSKSFRVRASSISIWENRHNSGHQQPFSKSMSVYWKAHGNGNEPEAYSAWFSEISALRKNCNRSQANNILRKWVDYLARLEPIKGRRVHSFLGFKKAFYTSLRGQMSPMHFRWSVSGPRMGSHNVLCEKTKQNKTELFPHLWSTNRMQLKPSLSQLLLPKHKLCHEKYVFLKTLMVSKHHSHTSS